MPKFSRLGPFGDVAGTPRSLKLPLLVSRERTENGAGGIQRP